MIFWIIWFVLGVSIVILFACFFLPRIMMRTHAATLPIRDRAIGCAKDSHGAALYFEPTETVRRYISWYRIGRDAKGAYFQGEWARKIACAEYELVVYGAGNELIDVLRVKEKFNGGRLTRVTRLPKKADLITLRLVCIDDTPFPVERKKFNMQYFGWLATLCVSLAVTVDLLVWLVSTFIFRCMDGFTFTYSPPVWMWAVLLGSAAFAAIAVTCIYSLVRFLLMRRKGDRDV